MSEAPEFHPFISELDQILKDELARCRESHKDLCPNMAVLTIQSNAQLVFHGLAQILVLGGENSVEEDIAYGYFLPYDRSDTPRWMHIRRECLWPIVETLPPRGSLPPFEDRPFRIQGV